MRKYRQHDCDDGFDEASLFDDEAMTFERSGRQRLKNPPNDRPEVLRSEKPARDTGKSDRRRELASANAWGAPY
jgi:hypothetical protein